jgi:hypothetical protein
LRDSWFCVIIKHKVKIKINIKPMNTNKSILIGTLAFALSLVVLVPSVTDESRSGGQAAVMFSSVLVDGETLAIEAPVEKPANILVAAVRAQRSKEVQEEEKAEEVKEEAEARTEEVSEVQCGLIGVKEAFEPVYDADIITVRKQYRHDLGERFPVKVFVKNSGNMPWFSEEAGCIGSVPYLGTTRDNDRESDFYDRSWHSKTRMALDDGQHRIDPGEIASFSFYMNAADKAGVHREYFGVYLDPAGWVEGAEFKVDVFSGYTNEEAGALRKKLLYAYKTMDVLKTKIEGTRVVEVDLSDQRMFLKIDDYVVREFIVSTGAPGTPTPRGDFPITEKNDIRVGSSPPHYIMPRFQRFTPQGAGLHALPSLSNDGGTFWTEALDHLGQPASHGCVRMSPDDADFAFAFTEMGDIISVHY